MVNSGQVAHAIRSDVFNVKCASAMMWCVVIHQYYFYNQLVKTLFTLFTLLYTSYKIKASG